MAVLLNKADLCSPSEVEALSAWYLKYCKAEAVFVGSAKDAQVRVHEQARAGTEAWAQAQARARAQAWAQVHVLVRLYHVVPVSCCVMVNYTTVRINV